MPQKKSHLSRLIASLRAERGYTVYRLAAMSGLSAQAIHDLESGSRADPRWSTVQALADSLGVPVEALREPKTAPEKNQGK